jgi:hypothetical protein
MRRRTTLALVAGGATAPTNFVGFMGETPVPSVSALTTVPCCGM